MAYFSLNLRHVSFMLTGTDTEAGAGPGVGVPGPSTFPLQQFLAISAEKNYLHLFNTAFDVAMAEMSFSQFPLIIKMQKRNGVQFAPGKDDRFACAEFVHFLAEAIREDIKQILNSASFFCGEMDGSEARKTKEEKELIYAKVVIRGQPVELLLKCQRMSDFGGVDAAATKSAFDQAFTKEYGLADDRFGSLLIGVCADGASVNMGRLHGACTEMKSNRIWLKIIHCVNHRLELAMGDAFSSNKAFENLDNMMIKIFYLFKNSGKNKRLIQRLAQRLNVTFIGFINTKGTRFQEHNYRGIKAMIVNYLSLLLFCENMVEADNRSVKPDIKAMLKGYHDRMVTYGYLATLELYRQVLRLTTHASLMFQNKQVLITDVMDSLTECKAGLEEIAALEETPFPFPVVVHEPDEQQDVNVIPDVTFTVTATNLPAKAQFLERSKMTKRQVEQNDKRIKTIRETFTLKRVAQGKQQVAKIKQQLIPAIKACIDKRFSGSFDDEVIQAMRISDHTTWDCDDDNYGKASVRTLAEHFAVPLEHHNFNLDLALRELNGVKKVKLMRFRGFHGKISFWEKIFTDYQDKFPHFLLIIELCLVMSFSSSTVERGFSTVKRHLSDSRLSLKNSTLNDLLLLRVNIPVLKRLDPNYEEKLIQKGVKMYLNSPKLKRGRYNKTSTSQSQKDRIVQPSGTTPDLFLPVPASRYTEAVNPLLASDGENSESDSEEEVLYESGSESDSDTQAEDDDVLDISMEEN